MYDFRSQENSVNGTAPWEKEAKWKQGWSVLQGSGASEKPTVCKGDF